MAVYEAIIIKEKNPQDPAIIRVDVARGRISDPIKIDQNRMIKRMARRGKIIAKYRPRQAATETVITACYN